MQSRKRVAPLVSEFASVHSVVLPLALATKFLTPGYKLPASWAVGKSVSCTPPIASFPAGSRVLRAHIIQGDKDGPVGLSVASGSSGLDPSDLPCEPSRSKEGMKGLRGHSGSSGLDPSAPPCAPARSKTNSIEGAGLDPAKQEVKKAMQSGDPEAVATLVNRQAKVAARDLSLLLDLLPSESLRWSGASQPTAKSFQAGSFVHGGVRGIRSTTRKFPECTKAICTYVRQLFPTLTFGTVGLFRDVCAIPHRDSNNEAFTDNAIAALSSFEEGGLWMEDPDGTVAMDFQGKAVIGVKVPVDRRGFRFDGRRLHAALPWSGRRDVVVAYMARGPELLTTADQCSLRQAGFPLAKEDTVSESSSKKEMVKVVIGVYRTPEQFVSEAMAIGHPSMLSSLLPPELLEAVQAIHRRGEGSVAKDRTAVLRMWLQWVSELAHDEEELKAGPR